MLRRREEDTIPVFGVTRDENGGHRVLMVVVDITVVMLIGIE